jgi:hypothetical protein
LLSSSSSSCMSWSFSLPTGLFTKKPSKNRISSWNRESQKLKENRQRFMHKYDGSNQKKKWQ